MKKRTKKPAAASYRYFLMDLLGMPRIVVFKRNEKVGHSHFPDRSVSKVCWTYKEMKMYPVSPEVSRTTAKKLVPSIP